MNGFMSKLIMLFLFFSISNICCTQENNDVIIDILPEIISNSSYLYCTHSVRFSENGIPQGILIARYYTYDGNFIISKEVINFSDGLLQLDPNARKPRPVKCEIVNSRHSYTYGLGPLENLQYFISFYNKNNYVICSYGYTGSIDLITKKCIAFQTTDECLYCAFKNIENARMCDILDLNRLEKISLKN